MKRLFTSSVFALIISFGLIAQESQYQVALIGFYNLENLFDTINQPDVNDDEYTPEGKNRYTGKVYRDKLKKLSRVISEMGLEQSPDGVALLGVAEIENRSVLEDLVNAPKLRDRKYQIVHVDGPDERGVDVALLYNPKYFTVKSFQSLRVPMEKIESKSPRPTRDVLFVSGDFFDETMFLFVNHWSSRRGGEEASRPYRELAASVCKHKIDSLTAINPDYKIILMGDLNDDPISSSVAVVLNAKGEKAQVKRGGLYNPWLPLYKKGIGTLAWNDAWNLFDQIIISSAFLNKKQDGFFYKEAIIFNRDYMIQQTGRFKGYPFRSYVGSTYKGGYSDHFPTYIVLLKKIAG